LSFVDGFRLGLSGYLRRNALLYLVVLGLLVGGVCLGATAVKVLDREEKADLVRYLATFLRGLSDGKLRSEPSVALRAACLQNLKTVGFLWGLGLTVVGIPAVAAVVFLRGLAVGFTVAFLVDEMGQAGLLLAAGAVLPQNLLALPALVLIAVSSLSFSLLLVRRHWDPDPRPLAEEVLGYGFVALLACLLMVGAGLLEACVAPVFMRLIAGYAMS